MAPRRKRARRVRPTLSKRPASAKRLPDETSDTPPITEDLHPAKNSNDPPTEKDGQVDIEAGSDEQRQSGPRLPLRPISIRGDNTSPSVSPSKTTTPLKHAAVPLVGDSHSHRPVLSYLDAFVSESAHASTRDSMPTEVSLKSQPIEGEGTEVHASAPNSFPLSIYDSDTSDEEDLPYISRSPLSVSFDLRPASWDHRGVPPLEDEEELPYRRQLTVSFALRPASWDHRGVPPLNDESGRLVIVG